jgi:NitT/TauT family transport system permease protein
MRAILWGLFAMVAVIVLTDQLLWRPLIAWSDKFKFEQVEAADLPRSPVLNFLRYSRILKRFVQATVAPAREALTLYFAKRHTSESRHTETPVVSRWRSLALPLAALAVILYGTERMGVMLTKVSRPEVWEILRGAGATFLRVEFALLLAGLWTIPVGVFIGLRPRLSAIAQPIAQIAASVPAPALFPIVLLLLIRIGGGLGIASIVLLLLGTQWYILFNVIAGATAIPSDLKEVCSLFHLSNLQRWRTLFLPAIFPYLVTGFVTASGGAWNASIIAEYFKFRDQTFTVVGLGAVISRATDAGNFPVLLGATVAITAMVLTVNRLLWRRLYTLASTKYKLEFT